MKESLTIIIPCYNEEDVLETTFQRLLGILPMIPELEVSFLFVNDGSKDGTAMILNRFAREQERVQVIHFSRNFGHQSAVTAGINHAVSDYVVVIDADLQDPPEAIPEMWHYLKDQNANVVYGVRQERRDETWFKKCTAKIFYRLLNYLSETPSRSIRETSGSWIARSSRSSMPCPNTISTSEAHQLDGIQSGPILLSQA